jgi:hypothetical protein
MLDLIMIIPQSGAAMKFARRKFPPDLQRLMQPSVSSVNAECRKAMAGVKQLREPAVALKRSCNQNATVYWRCEIAEKRTE